MTPFRPETLALALLALLVPLGLAGCLEAPPASRPGADGNASGTQGGGSGGGGGGAAPADPRAEALAFSLRVVETYFTGDYAAFRGMLAEEIFSLEGDGPMSREDVDGFQRDRSWPSGRDYRNFTLEQYLATYEPEALTWDEAKARFPAAANVSWEGWSPDADDYVFVGWETKEGKEAFLWDDLLVFVVSRESGEWRFKAFGG